MSKPLLTVAGYDPTGGAGILLDIKVFQKLGFYGIGIITAMTDQNTERVKDVLCSDPKWLKDQSDNLLQDIIPLGIKIGMVGCQDNISIISTIIQELSNRPIVVDPVFTSSTGYWLLEETAIPNYLQALGAKITLLTPNLREAEYISGIKLRSVADMKEAAKIICTDLQIPCLIKGGHLEKQATDVVFDGENYFIFEKERLPKKVHGTGCFLSSSLLCYLAMDYSLKTACEKAINLTQVAIKNARAIGKGQYLISV